MSRVQVEAGPGAGALADASFVTFAHDAAAGLLRLAHALTGERAAAEDLVQETVVRVGLAWARITGEPSAYARRTMLNLFLNERRKRRRETLVATVADRATADSDQSADQVAALDAARTLLRQLPDRQRAAVAMRYVLALDDERIADALGCTPSTVRSQIARGLATLRTQHSASFPSPPPSPSEEDHR